MAKPRKRKSVRASKDVKEEKLALRELVAQITKRNRCAEILTGPARGKEILS
jgi:hypothetical protein